MIAETSGDAVVYKYVRGAGLLYTENAAEEKTWYDKDAHDDTVQWRTATKLTPLCEMSVVCLSDSKRRFLRYLQSSRTFST